MGGKWLGGFRRGENVRGDFGGEISTVSQLKVYLQITFVPMEINYAAIITIREGITNSGWGRIFSKDLKKG